MNPIIRFLFWRLDKGSSLFWEGLLLTVVVCCLIGVGLALLDSLLGSFWAITIIFSFLACYGLIVRWITK